MADREGTAHGQCVTTAMPSHQQHRWSSAADPSGEELRRALLVPARTASRVDAAHSLTVAAALILVAGISRVLMS